jgi:hypothetical protein
MSEEKGQITLVAPNGQTEDEKYHPQHTVQHTLDAAVRDFGKRGWLDTSLPYLLVMNGAPLTASETLEQAGVRAGARLSVRSKTVPGDGDAPGVL